MAISTLQAIRSKVRRLTRSPSIQNLTDADINEYINTFIAYDMPEHLRQNALRRTLTFYLQPYQDIYKTTTTNVNDPLYNFKQRYLTVHPPVYISGIPAAFTQSRQEFFTWYPLSDYMGNLVISNGTPNYVGTITTGVPIVRNSLSFSMVNNIGIKFTTHDTGELDPITGLGILAGDGGAGTINYRTGAYTIAFLGTPAAGTFVTIEYKNYVAGKPTSVLYFNNEFTVRPIPDKSYSFSVEVYLRPSELIDGQSPELEEWWQWIAFAASKKIYEDRSNFDAANALMPALEEQRKLVERRTLVQQADEVAATIYNTPKTNRWFYGDWR